MPLRMSFVTPEDLNRSLDVCRFMTPEDFKRGQRGSCNNLWRLYEASARGPGHGDTAPTGVEDLPRLVQPI
ncbi:hypothetical protein Taro_007358 [Colocasia esculenta]|uniref:Uncharacterized protein n=1 Tax=Colocasia esculenta TaxID=4460 RepID=A0A843U3L5_COLES|nr:hypothetical protein [Colocasia esculenta]